MSMLSIAIHRQHYNALRLTASTIFFLAQLLGQMVRMCCASFYLNLIVVIAFSRNFELHAIAVPLNDTTSPLANDDNTTAVDTVTSVQANSFISDTEVLNPRTGNEDNDANDDFELFTGAGNDASNSSGRMTEIIAGSTSACAAIGALVGLVLFPILRYIWRQRGSYSLDPTPSTRRLAGFSSLFRRKRKEPEAIPILERYQKDTLLEQTGESTDHRMAEHQGALSAIKDGLQ